MATPRLPVDPAPAPLEEYARWFDDLFGSRAGRRGFRDYLAGLLAQRDRNKTLTALAGTEPGAGSKHREAQRLENFLAHAPWDHEQVNARRLELLVADPVTAPHGGGVLVLDDTGDRKAGAATAHVGTQYLGSVGKVDHGIVAVTTVWADEHVYYPVHAEPYTPAHHFPRGKNDPGFRTKLVIGAQLAVRAAEAGFGFRAVVADAAYGDQDRFRVHLWDASAVCDGAQAAPRHLGLRRPGAHPDRRRRRAGLGRPRRARALDGGDTHLPRRAHRDLVGCQAPLKMTMSATFAVTMVGV